MKEDDEEKLASLCTDLEMLKYKYEFESDEYNKKLLDFKKLANKTINHLLSDNPKHKIKIKDE